MKEINTNLVILQEKILQITELRAECNRIDIQAVTQEGGGTSIEMLNILDKEYLYVKEAILLLLDKSALFFANTKESLEDADTKASGYTK